MNKPNIIVILADDLGYGDVSCCNGESRLHTVHMDRMAREGMRFTNAHACSSVCTPSRYGLLTGRYCWRGNLKSSVLGGYSRHLVETGRMTVADLLKRHGYATACIGKWHLGMDWPRARGGPAELAYDPRARCDGVDYTRPIQNGPTAYGFDRFFGISASLDMPPHAYIENDRVTAAPDRITRSVDTKAFWREGPTSPDFRPVEVLPRLTEEAAAFVRRQAQSHPRQPFFLYFPLPAPHTPILPLERFIGASGTNLYGDFVLQVDWTVGEILKALDETGQAENTLVLMTSDNGCSPRADFKELESVGHHPSYHFRGHKADIFEGGHRMPFIARWPASVKPGAVSDDIICLTDLMRTCAGMLGAELPDDAGEDSLSFLPALLGEPGASPMRESVVLHSINGSFAIRRGDWKLEMCADSGGWSFPRPGSDSVEGLPPIQLYDLADDVGEQRNLCEERPALVEELRERLSACIRDGRSTPGAPQPNAAAEPWPQVWWMDEPSAVETN
ncbi:MAG: arylsulfatase [Kiritimatiellae bacterium]|nr:arylsulfatase [Kiritimatiellia bacterium]